MNILFNTFAVAVHVVIRHTRLADLVDMFEEWEDLKSVLVAPLVWEGMWMEHEEYGNAKHLILYGGLPYSDHFKLAAVAIGCRRLRGMVDNEDLYKVYWENISKRHYKKIMKARFGISFAEQKTWGN